MAARIHDINQNAELMLLMILLRKKMLRSTSIKALAMLLMPLIAGGRRVQIDPTQIQVTDLAKTIQDPLAAKLRERLKSDFGIVKNSKGTGLPASRWFSVCHENKPLKGQNVWIVHQVLAQPLWSRQPLVLLRFLMR
ncbi:unnamed protein product [Ranitomeya imitator]|uniref:Uncharacterized protein n=1 Tax=Ranitomeya imitator TaxID=111125 RepID=A0ABN9LF22_9NEOB|nr:unnamed protein product [Ranitomeya imitator]